MRLVALRSMEAGDADDTTTTNNNKDHGDGDGDDDGKDAVVTTNTGFRGPAAAVASPVRDRSDSVVSTASETHHRRMSRHWSSREARALLMRGEPAPVGAEAAGASSALSPSPLRSGGGGGGNGGGGGGGRV